MDKNRISDDKKTTVQVHSLPAVGMRGIHRQYGLWIIRGTTGWITRPDSYVHCPERYFQYYSISHMYDGAGLFWLKDTDVCTEVQPGDFVIVTPQTVHRYGGWAGKSYCEDALIFSGPVADMLMRSGILSSGVAYTLQIITQKHLSAAIAALVMSLESVFAALTGWIVLHEHLSAREFVGCVLVFVATLLAQVPASTGTVRD